MKRGKPLKRNTPLKATQGLKRTGRLNPMSKKRKREQAERRKVIEEILKTRLLCEATQRIWKADYDHRCQREPHDIHEPLTRARGGSITDPANMIVVCRACHDWIHRNPKLATEVGLLRSAYNTGYDGTGEQLDD